MEIEVALLSPYPLLRDSLTRLLRHRSMIVTSATSDRNQLYFDSPRRSECSRLILVDSLIQAEQGFYAELRLSHPGVRLVVLADGFDGEAVRRAMHEGVDGYLLKEASLDVLAASLRLIALGEKVIPPAMATHAVKRKPVFRSEEIERAHLSDREIAVLRLLVRGDSNKAIGQELGILDATVKVHVKAALRKLGLANRTQAAIWAFQHGFGEERESTPCTNEPLSVHRVDYGPDASVRRAAEQAAIGRPAHSHYSVPA